MVGKRNKPEEIVSKLRRLWISFAARLTGAARTAIRARYGNSIKSACGCANSSKPSCPGSEGSAIRMARKSNNISVASIPVWTGRCRRTASSGRNWSMRHTLKADRTRHHGILRHTPRRGGSRSHEDQCRRQNSDGTAPDGMPLHDSGNALGGVCARMSPLGSMMDLGACGRCRAI